MVDLQWRFPKMPPALINQEPMERELFEGEAINTRLVRESIQNSLDAGLDRERRRKGDTPAPVQLRFSLAGIRAPLPEARAAPYFAGLSEHLRCCTDSLDRSLELKLNQGGLIDGGVPYIVIEDRGTIGLNGDWRQYDDSDMASARANHFYWFFRNVGRSAKSENDNGSWGLGKWVFPDASHASCYIAVTRRQDDDDTLLMGQSVLQKHSIGGQRYAPYGYLSDLGEEELPLPLRRSNPEHRPLIDQCIADFGLQFRDAPGLSVIVPFPKTEHLGETEAITLRQLLNAVVHHYFYPIVAGWLEVAVDPGDGSPEVAITAGTIDGVVSRLGLYDDGETSEEGYRHLFALCRQAMALPEERYVPLPEPPGGETQLAQHPEIAALRPDYEARQLLAFRIDTNVQRQKGSLQASSYRVYLQRDESLDAGHDYYVRGTLSISEMNLIRQRRARALLVVDEGAPLAGMLRDSEPPKHTQWRPQNEKVAQKWVSARSRINAVRSTPDRLLRLLDAPPEGVDKDAFADVFSWDGAHPVPPTPPRPPIPAPIPPPPTPPVPPPPPPPRQPRGFTVTQLDDGFRVSIAARSQSRYQAGDALRLEAAYEVARGNPLSLYQPHDFRLHGDGCLAVQVEGAEASPGGAGNELALQIADAAQFSVTVRGFDPLRDVYVSIDRVAGRPTDDGEDSDDPSV